MIFFPENTEPILSRGRLAGHFSTGGGAAGQCGRSRDGGGGLVWVIEATTTESQGTETTQFFLEKALIDRKISLKLCNEYLASENIGKSLITIGGRSDVIQSHKFKEPSDL